MKLALVGLAHPFRGGVAHFTASLARTLETRHEVKLFSLAKQYPRLLFPGRTQMDKSESPHRYPAEPVLKPLNPLSWLETGRRIRAFSPDVVVMEHWHPFFAPCYAAAALLAKKGGARVVVEMHNVLPHEATPLDRMLLAPLLRAADGFVVHSAQDASVLAGLVRGKPVTVGFHPRYSHFSGIRGSISREEARRKLGVPADCRLLLFFGLVRAYKGLMDLLDAAPLVPLDSSFRVLVVGEFYDDKEKYLRRIQELGIHDLVQVQDQYVPDEEVAVYFAACDVVVLPYRTATQSGIAQIAFAEGRPVIVTDVGGLPEAVAHGQTGLIAQASNPASLADMIRRFFDGNLGPQMERTLAERSSEGSWEALAAIIEDLIRKLS